MSRKAMLVLAMVLAAGSLAWAKPELGADGRPLPPHLRNKGPQVQKQQPAQLKQQPGRPQMPVRPAGRDARKPEISKTFKAKPAQAGKAMPRPSIKGVVKDEFLVNDDVWGVGYYAGYQYDPKAALLPTGEMMVVWYDERNSWNYQVFARCYDAAGNPVGEDFLVNQFTGTYAEYPAVTACGNGFLVTWVDYRSGNDYDIYARRYDAAGSPIGGDFLVNDDVSGYDQYYPSAAANDSGFIITWEDSRSGSYWDIYAQRYDASGSPVGGNFIVNDEAGSCDHYQYGGGNISASDSGFMITWYDYRSGSSWDIYAQRYNNIGDTLGGNFLVNESGTGSDHYDPSVAASDSGFLITWYDYRNGNGDIYAQLYKASGDTIGGNFMVNDDGGSYDQYDPIVAASDSGFVVTWYDYRSGSYWDIYAQRYDQAGSAMGGNFIVNDTTSIYCYSPSLAANDSGFAIVWYDTRYNPNGYYDIFCQRYDADGDTLGSNFMVNNDNGTADQWDASVAMDQSGNSVVVWYDMRNDDGSWNTEDIYGQLYDADGKPVGANFIINDTLTGDRRYGYDPRAAFLPDGGFVVTWYNYDLGWNGDIYVQLFDSAGTPVGGNFEVRGGAASSGYVPDVAVSDSGFVIAWYDYRSGNSDIYAQLFKANGDTVGGNFLVDDGGNSQYSPRVASCGSSFVIAWQDERSGNSDIYAQRFNANGDTVGGNFLVDDGGNYQYNPSVVMGDSGFVIAWYDYRYDGGYPDIYAQQYKINGDTIGGNFRVNDDVQGAAYHYYPSVALSPDGHKMVIAWEDYRNDPNGNVAEVMAQKYVDGVADGGNVVVNGTTLANRYFWGGKRVACTDQRVIFTWDDNRRFKGGDVYAKLTDWDLQHIQDAIPPYIVSTSPSDGAVDVALNEPVVVVFSEPMNTSSINGYAIPTDDYSLSWNAAGDTMTLTPGTPYSYSTTYSVIVTAGTDTSGNSIAVLPDTFITFTTLDNQAPAIAVIQQPVSTFDGSGPFDITAVLTDAGKKAKVGVVSNQLWWQASNEYTWHSLAASVTSGDTCSYSIPGPVAAGLVINAYVEAVDDGNDTTYSNMIQFQILSPMAPTGLMATTGQDGTVPLSWTAPAESLYYYSPSTVYAFNMPANSIVSTRYTPGNYPCRIDQIRSSWNTAVGNSAMHFRIYGDDGHGFPDEGNVIFDTTYTPTAGTWADLLNLSAYDLVVTSGDFHVSWEILTYQYPRPRGTQDGGIQQRSLYKWTDGIWYADLGGDWFNRVAVSYSNYGKGVELKTAVLSGDDQRFDRVNKESLKPLADKIAKQSANLPAFDLIKNIGEYQIFRSTLSGGPYAFLNGTTSLTYDDNSVINDSTYYYVVRTTYPWATHADTFSAWSNEATATPTGVEGQPGVISYSFYLMPASPNPVSNSAEFRFGLAKGARASLGIYNVLGQRVKTLVNGNLAAGNHAVRWNACDDNGRKVSSGVYIYRLTAGENTSTRRFTVIR